MSKVILIIIALFLPPLAVFLKYGLESEFWINLILTLVGFFPGMVHALYVVTKK